MLSILAQGTAETIGIVVGTAVLVLGGNKGVGAIAARRNGGNGNYNKPLCDERHRNIDARQAELKESLGKIDGKLDKRIEDQMGGGGSVRT